MQRPITNVSVMPGTILPFAREPGERPTPSVPVRLAEAGPCRTIMPTDGYLGSLTR